VIYRVPREMSVVRPPSHCPACNAPIRAWQNIPVLGWVLLRGRARCCGVRVSARYPLVEAIGGVVSLAIIETVVLRMSGSTDLVRALAVYAVYLALALALVAAAFIDVEFMILPDGITLGGAALGIASAPLRSMGFVDSIFGALVGFLVIWLPFIFLFPRITGRKGMGLGDAKLLALAGAWFGWLGGLVVLGAGAIQGSLVAIAVMLFKGKIEEPEAVRREREENQAALEELEGEERAELERELAEDPLKDEPEEGFGKARIAFGPFLILAILEGLLFGTEIQGALLGWMGLE